MNDMVGDIVKVTPSSKMVGDMAIFMVKNNLTPANIYEKAKNMAFPDSVVSYFKGMMGQPEWGFPEKLQRLVLKEVKPVSARPGEMLPDEDFNRIEEHLREKYRYNPSRKDIVSYALYPDVLDDYLKFVMEYGDFSRMGSDVFFHGLAEGETCEIEVAEGRILIVRLVEIGKPDAEGNRVLEFEVNGNRREIRIKDKTEIKSRKADEVIAKIADPSNKNEIGASIPGNIVKVLVKEGDKVIKGQSLVVIEAMKMETVIIAPDPGIIDSVYVKEGQNVKTGELLARIKLASTAD